MHSAHHISWPAKFTVNFFFIAFLYEVYHFVSYQFMSSRRDMSFGLHEGSSWSHVMWRVQRFFYSFQRWKNKNQTVLHVTYVTNLPICIEVARNWPCLFVRYWDRDVLSFVWCVCLVQFACRAKNDEFLVSNLHPPINKSFFYSLTSWHVSKLNKIVWYMFACMHIFYLN